MKNREFRKRNLDILVKEADNRRPKDFCVRRSEDLFDISEKGDSKQGIPMKKVNSVETKLNPRFVIKILILEIKHLC
jgi:hypothetical protein